MSRATRLMAGLILVLVPSIELGGSFLLHALIEPAALIDGLIQALAQADDTL